MKRIYALLVPVFILGLLLTSCGSSGGGGGSNGGNVGEGSNDVTDTTILISVDSNGNQGSSNSSAPSISSDGGRVAFESNSTDLITGSTTNGRSQIFIRDLNTNATTLASVDSNGNQGNFDSSAPSISSDGSYVAFESNSTNLLTGSTTNGRSQIFIRDLNTDATTLVSVDSNGDQGNFDSSAPSISSDGSYVAFESNSTNLITGITTNGLNHIFVHDLNTDATTLVSVDSNGDQGNFDSSAPSISSDGRYVAFESNSTNLITGITTNGRSQIFIRDLNTDATTLVSVDSNGDQGNFDSLAPSISSDGSYVAFESVASDLVTGDTNGLRDIFVHDIDPGTTIRVSVDSNGGQSTTNNSSAPSISLDGSYVAFESVASDLVTGDTNGLRDIFVHDIDPGTTIRVSVDSNGDQSTTNNSSAPSISLDGSYVAFESLASDLVTGDTNAVKDIFLRGP